MPIYEYACRDCGEHVEVVQSFKDEPLSTCGLCGGALRKVFSAAGIIFKGSGYYVTDNRKQDKAASGSKSDGEASKSDDAASKAKADSTSSGPAAESA
jgi:putative FmdB family regulatory protein